MVTFGRLFEKFLVGIAEMRASAANCNSCYFPAAGFLRTIFPFAAVCFVMELKQAALSIGGSVIRHRVAAEVYTFSQNGLDCRIKFCHKSVCDFADCREGMNVSKI